ncbi:MAG: carboxypeptidase-like regulatory domain-containing protein [Chryseolinea sp.]
MARNLLLLLIFLLPVTLFAQTGSIKGRVLDAVSGESIPGANILVIGAGVGAAADVEGNFDIPKVKAGTYSILISFISYKTDTLKEVTVYPDQTTAINHKMIEEGTELSEVVVQGVRVTNTDFAVITELRKNDLVAVGISSQQITMSQDRDAAQIMKRIPGVTIMNNRFVNIRGLNERYNTVLLNGIIAPSTEVDSKAFAFDLIPSNMIDRMLVYKSGAAELPGEWAGGIVGIHTKSVVEENSLSVNVTTGFRAGTTGKDFYTTPGSSTDVLGYDNGFRDLPSAFPTQNLRELSNSSTDQDIQKLTAASKSLPNRWEIKKISAAPDARATINFAHVFNIGEHKLSNITSINYSKTNQTINQQNSYYDAFNEQVGSSTRRYLFNDSRYLQTVRAGFISNFIYEINPANKIEFRNLFNQQGISQVTTRAGVEDFQGYEVNNRALNYYSRGIYSGQLQGKHNIGDHFYATWIAGYSKVNADQPDYRRIRSQRGVATDDGFATVIPPGANAFDAGRFYSKLNEKVYTGALNFEYKFNPSADEKKQAKIMFGGYAAQTKRDFSARWFSYKWSTLGNRPPDLLSSSPFETLFTPANIGFSSNSGQAPYFVLEEGTNLSDKYTGDNLLKAGYVSTTIPFADKFRVATGVRVENNIQKLSSFETDGTVVKVKNPVTSVLPFFNMSFNYTEKALVRVSYGKSVNRPVFRELAPFNFYDFDRNANLYGNKNLKVADIHNVDLRWELYPSANESISFGVFYKYFKNPIESELIGGSNIIYTYTNGNSATNYGAEFEARKSFNNWTSNNFLNKLSVVLNAAYIHSQVNLGDVANQEKKRAMQGQSPYIVNTALNYNNVEAGWQANVSFNRYGKRIFAVGDLDQNATQYEMPRNQLDFTISKDLGRRWEVKLGIQDILNSPYRLTQDSNRDRKINSVDEPITYYKTGQYVSLGATFKVY